MGVRGPDGRARRALGRRRRHRSRGRRRSTARTWSSTSPASRLRPSLDGRAEARIEDSRVVRDAPPRRRRSQEAQAPPSRAGERIGRRLLRAVRRRDRHRRDRRRTRLPGRRLPAVGGAGRRAPRSPAHARGVRAHRAGARTRRRRAAEDAAAVLARRRRSGRDRDGSTGPGFIATTGSIWSASRSTRRTSPGR